MSLLSYLYDLENDEKFQLFIKKYNRPNCFKIIGNDHYELRHSSFIAWLLNPVENHGLGTYPMHLFLGVLSGKGNRKYNEKELEIEKLNVNTEYPISSSKKGDGRIDVYAYNEKMVMILENKVKSKENYNDSTNMFQTDAYYQYFEQQESDKERIYVYLHPTSSGENAKNKNFIHITYQELYDQIIFKCIHYSKISVDTRYVLEQYAASLTQTPLLAYTYREEAEQIYKKYQEFFEQLREEVKDEAKKELCSKFLKNQKYINEILGSVGKQPIYTKTLEGYARIVQLCEEGIILLDKTELVYERKKYGFTYVIQVTKNKDGYWCYSGCYEGVDYKGYKTQNAWALEKPNGELWTFQTINEAAKNIEVYIYLKHNLGISSSPGVQAGQWTIYFSGKEEYEGKTLSEIP